MELILAQGAESLGTDNNKGTLPYLTPDQMKALDKHLQENVYSDSKGLGNRYNKISL